jgi:hypothetical protein
MKYNSQLTQYLKNKFKKINKKKKNDSSKQKLTYQTHNPSYKIKITL